MSSGSASAGRFAWLIAWLIAFSIIITLLAAGIILLVGSQPRGEPIRLLSPPTPQPLVVQVGGEVANPGVYSLPAGSRVKDAIELSGGLLPKADISLLNQAALLEDGGMIWVPASQPSSVPAPAAQPVVTGVPPKATSSQPLSTQAPAFPISLNTASAKELEALPGIGPKLAQRIVDYRQAHGPFATIEDIQSVEGIGPGILDKIKELITVQVMP